MDSFPSSTSAKETLSTQPASPARQLFPQQPPNQAFIERKATEFVNGLVTLDEITRKYGPKVLDSVVKKIYTIDPNAIHPKPAPTPEAPHSSEVSWKNIPEVLATYWDGNRTEAKEDLYLKLHAHLMKDPKFREIVNQNTPLMNDNNTEEYEKKIMGDYYELCLRNNSRVNVYE